MRISLIFCLALVVQSASAADWRLTSGGAEIGAARRSANASERLRATPTSATDDVNIIDVSQCENIDVGQVADTNGDGTGATALTATLEWCPFPHRVGDTAAGRDAACVDYSSGTLTGDGTLQGAGVPSGFIRVQMGGTFAGDPTLWLKCNGPTR